MEIETLMSKIVILNEELELDENNPIQDCVELCKGNEAYEGLESGTIGSGSRDEHHHRRLKNSIVTDGILL